MKSASELFNIIGEKTRLELIRICMSGERTASELMAFTKTEKTLLSKHLKVLQDANVLTVKKEGRNRVYSVNKSICHKKLKNTLDLHCCKIELK